MKNKATENTEGTERRLEKVAKLTAEITETAEEARGIEIRLRRAFGQGTEEFLY